VFFATTVIRYIKRLTQHRLRCAVGPRGGVGRGGPSGLTQHRLRCAVGPHAASTALGCRVSRAASAALCCRASRGGCSY